MRGKALILFVVLVAITLLALTKPKSTILVGAYYFDGWTGAYPYHITKKLIDSFPEREPKWGWKTSSQQYVDDQIKEAKSYGINFFSFCWYYSKQEGSNLPINNALGLYKKSKYRSKLKYCLLVANHAGFEIDPNAWQIMCDEWVQNFSNGSYLSYKDKPLIIFFSANSFVKSFGGIVQAKAALDTLRKKAITANLTGVSIGVCTGASNAELKMAEQCGFDLLTGYNYHSAGFGKNVSAIPIDSLVKKETTIWDIIVQQTNLDYIPVITLNWDPRPWAYGTNMYVGQSRYLGFSANSVFTSISNGLKWLENRQDILKKQQSPGFLLVYAWNENGEGAWLTPSKNGEKVGLGLKKALKR